jgi:hypothetical protein
VIFESGGKFRDVVVQLVGNDVERPGEIRKDAAVPVAEDHLTTVPERVVKGAPVVDIAVETHPVAIERPHTQRVIVVGSEYRHAYVT